MELYDDQKLVATKFENWLNNSSSTTAGLWASAGYGKSFMVKHLISEVVLNNSNYIPVLASMTHSAVAVLAKFTGMQVSTLHSYMGWLPLIDKDTGEETLSTPKMRKKKEPPRLTSNMLLIVDEAGLMGHDELALLLAECKETGARVLFVGDNKQCFPVIKDGQKLCVPAYDATECILNLTIPKRVDKGDMIYKLSLVYREAVDGGRQPRLKTLLNTDGSGKGVRYVDDLEEYAYKAFEVGKRDGNMRNIKVLAFRNSRCLKLNAKIRKKVMGLTDMTPIVGEEMVANTAINNATKDQVLISNNQMVIVKEVEKTESHGLQGAFILYEDLEGNLIEEAVFVPQSPERLQESLNKLKNEAKKLRSEGRDEESKERWRHFYHLKESCADIRFTYAMTVNKAQGVTLKHVLIDLDDINTCREREQRTRLAYTAVTRATDYVTIEGNLD